MQASILIVEDESIVQFDLQIRLQRLGYAVVGVASSGEEAISKAAQLKPDLILMDVRLEGRMDGLEAAQKIKATQDVPVLFLTAHAAGMREEQTAALKPCVAKPFRVPELVSAIANALQHAHGNGFSDS
jgi:CheY-like chemotaxis protein